jgi:hypothetical protein
MSWNNKIGFFSSCFPIFPFIHPLKVGVTKHIYSYTLQQVFLTLVLCTIPRDSLRAGERPGDELKMIRPLHEALLGNWKRSNSVTIRRRNNLYCKILRKILRIKLALCDKDYVYCIKNCIKSENLKVTNRRRVLRFRRILKSYYSFVRLISYQNMKLILNY